MYYFLNPIVFDWPADRSHDCLQQPFLSFSVEKKNSLDIKKEFGCIVLYSISHINSVPILKPTVLPHLHRLNNSKQKYD